MFRKAQAAMEFLMTYGWAILVVLVVIGALAYFGVLSPSTLLPEKCTFPVSVNCVDHSVTNDYVSLVLLNGAGRDMKIRGLTATGEALGEGKMCTTDVGAGQGGPPESDDDCPSSSGIGVNGCTGGSVLRNGAKTTATIRGQDCTFVDTGRDKNRYNVTVYYSWLDSPTLMHTLPGELLARKP